MKIKKTIALFLALLLLGLTACGTAAPTWTEEVVEQSDRLYINELYNVYLPLATMEGIEQKTAELNWNEPEKALSFDEAAEALRAAMVAREESVAIWVDPGTEGPDNALIRQLFDAACAHTDRPNEGDYLFENVVWYYVPEDGFAVNENGEARIYYAFGYADTAEEEAAIDAWVRESLDSLRLDGLSEVEKAREIYGFLCTHIEYDYSYTAPRPALIKSFSAYNASRTGKAVCLGFALSSYRFFMEAGIDARLIVSSAMEHAYDLIQVDGEYYFIDATWDSAYFPNLHYFLRSEPQWLANHYYYREREDGSFDYSREIHDIGDFIPVPVAQTDHPEAGNCTSEFLEQPESLTAAVGDEVTFHARATEDVMQIEWQKYNEESELWETYETSFETCEATLTLTANEKLDGACFRCCCWSSVYTGRIISATAVLTVTDATE